MAEEDVAEGAAKGSKNFLTKKVGPLPLGVWIVAAIAIYYYYSKKSKTTGSSAQTDPAGNTGQINPSTGYVYGSPQDLSAQGSNNGLGTGSSSSSGSTTAGQYADNTAWANAAINYLVGIGVDPTAANSAIEQFLSSQTLTTNQQADVNLAIQRIGAPPSPPQPGNAPPPIVTPPGPGTTYASNPPNGLTTSSVSTSSVGLKWNSVTNANAYTVSHGTTSAASDGSTTVSSPNTSTTITGLKPNTLYYFRVQAQPAKSGAPFASTSKTTSKDGGSGGGTPPKPAAVYNVSAQDVANNKGNSAGILDGIAKKYGVDAATLWSYNINPQVRSPQTAAHLQAERAKGGAWLSAGESIVIPPKNWK